MRWLAALLVLLCGGCGLIVNTPQTSVPPQSPAQRLVLSTLLPDRTGTALQPVDPNTLEDDPTVGPLDLPPCSSGLVVQPTGGLAVAATGAAGFAARCSDQPSATLNILDLGAWTWRTAISLLASDDAPLRLDVTDRWPLAWSPASAPGQAGGGRYVYAITTSPSEQRQL